MYSSPRVTQRRGRRAQKSLYYDAAQRTPMVIVALAFIVLLVTSFIVFGVAFARIKLMPRWAGVGYAVSGRFCRHRVCAGQLDPERGGGSHDGDRRLDGDRLAA